MKYLMIATVVSAVLSAKADTIAWWHLDELDVGELSDNTTAPFVNAINSSRHAGLARETPKVSGQWGTKGDYKTKGGAAFPDGACWYDPVNGNRAVNARGVEFRPSADSSRASGPVIVIPADSELIPSSFTYEFFFKPDPTYSDKSKQYIMLDRAGVTDGTPNVGLRVYYQYATAGSKVGMVVFERPVDPDGGTNYLIRSETYTASSAAYNNERWHHAAIAYDGASKKVSFYVDYGFVGSTTLTIAPISTQDLTFGNSSAGWGAYEGLLDEFRISDRVLAPGEFLSVVDEGLPQMFPETAVYQRFSSYPAFFGPRLASDLYDMSLLRNVAPADRSLGSPGVTVFGDGYAASSEVPVGNVATGRVGAAACAANGTAVALRSNADSRDPRKWTNPSLQKSCPCWNFPDAGAEVSTNDVTAELFFRTTNIAYTTYFFMLGRPAWAVKALGGNAGIAVNSTTVYSGSIADGKWHHLAFVADGTTKKGRLFLDYVQCGGEVEMGTLAAGKTFEEFVGVGCYGKDKLVTFFDVDLDEVRITRRKLALGEFLHETRENVLVDLAYDGAEDLRRAWVRQMMSVASADRSGSERTLDGTDKPNAHVADGVFAAAVTNVSSGRIVGGSGQTGSGYQSVSGAEIADLANTGFTIEFEAKLPADDYTNYSGEWAYFFAHMKNTSGVAYMLGFRPANGEFCFSLGYTPFATVAKKNWMDGAWHHYAFVYDKTASEVRAYLDHALVATKSGTTIPALSETLNFGAGLNSWGYTFGLHSWWHDNFRITQRALKPCEFKTVNVLSGRTLVWAPFDRSGALVSELGLTPTFSGTAWSSGAGRIENASGAVVRARNKGAFSGAAGAGAYSRLSLVERPDVSVEFFLRTTGAVAADTDLVKLEGPDLAPIWTVRVGTDGKMHVLVTPQGGTLTDLGAFADLPGDWKHVAVSFDPSSDGSLTRVALYFDHIKVREVSFDGRLAVEDISTSALSCGAFAGSVDELRLTKGALDPADMLYATKLGLLLIVK